MKPRRHLVVFARAPRLGTVKRRLARDIGPLAAWRFHRWAAESLLRRLARDPRWTCWLAVTPDRAARSGRGLWRAPVRLLAQGPGDLGRRMGRVLKRLPPGPVVIVGCDIPGIEAAHVAAAFAALGARDWVLGPAADGGYWLIGARRRPVLRLPFGGVRWGSRHARADTLANLAGRRVALLEELHDVDTGADLEALLRRKGSGQKASRRSSGAPEGGA
jgi:rSAM/selenodomain-associated transferase 1